MHKYISVLIVSLLFNCVAVADIFTYKHKKTGSVLISFNSVPPAGYRLIKRESTKRSSSTNKSRSYGYSPKRHVAVKKSSFDDLIKDISSTYRVEAALVKAMVHAESSFNPNAVSHKGARGLMQLMPATARRFGVRNSFNPTQNIVGGVKYIQFLNKRFKNNTRLVVAAYHAGEGSIDKYNGVPPYSSTRKYLDRVLSLRKQYQRTF